MKAISWWRILALTLLASAPLHAQDEPDKTLQVRFRVFGWDIANSDLFYAQNGSDASLEIYDNIRSPFHNYTGPATITFYRLKKGADGKIERIPAATANLADAGSWPLLLFFPAPGSPDNYQVQAIPDDLKSFPAGSFKFADFTDVPISGSLGSRAFELKPTEMETLPSPSGTNMTTVFATVYTETPQGRKTVYTNNWGIQPQMRTLVFVRKSPDTSTGVVARRIIESAVFPEDKRNHSAGNGSAP